LPPAMEELERRLRYRAQDAEDVIAKRMAKAKAEISHWDEYDYVIINTDLDATIKAVNHGQIFRFLTKPCPRDTLVSAIESAV